MTKNRNRVENGEEGSALALVLFFIVLISLWLGSVALLTQSTSSAIKTNISESKLRSDYVNLGIDAALIALTKNPACAYPMKMDGETWVGSCRSGTQVLPCSEGTVKVAIDDQLRIEAQKRPELLDKDGMPPVEVSCDNSVQSGFEDLGSLILVGDSTTCGAGCSKVVGIDGGLAIAASGASDPSTPMCSNFAMIITSASASADGKTITYVTKPDEPTLVVGETTTIRGVLSNDNPSGAAGKGFNVTNARINTVSPTQFTVTVTEAIADTYRSGGTASRGSSRYLVYGSVVNLSGNWNQVDCTNFEIVKNSPTDSDPQIIQPGFGDNTCLIPASCGTLNQWGGKANGFITSKLTTSKYNQVNALVSQIADKLDTFPRDSPATIDPPNASCTLFDTTNTGKNVITISPGINGYGYIQKSSIVPGELTLDRLNELTGSNACGDGGASGPAIIFKPGVYGFTGTSEPGRDTGGTPTNVWNVNFSGTIFAGLPNWEKDGTTSTPCGPDAANNGAQYDGVRFLFEKYSYFDLKKGRFIACSFPKPDPRGANFPKITQPIFSAPAITSYSSSTPPKFWWGSSGSTASNDAFFRSAVGNSAGGAQCLEVDVCLNFFGPIFAPASWLDISLNGSTVSTFQKGVIAKALSIKQTGSGPPTKSIFSSGILSTGDRHVQLNFFRRSSGQYLGSVQLKINDSGGYKLASGYLRKAWRVGW